MGLTRRILLATGGAAVVVTCAGVWELSRTAQKAREPWRRAGESFGDPRLDVLAYAILAPNPHNRQPWRVRLEEDKAAFTVTCDTTKMLPETDPPCRQITIGFGCFLELLRMAAAEKGYRAEVDPFPEGEPHPVLDDRPVAHVRLVADEGVAPDPLFAHVLTRRTNRTEFYPDRPIADDLLARLTGPGIAGGRLSATNDETLVETLRTLTVEAWRTEWETPRTRRETIAVTRIGRREIDEHPDGIVLEGPFLETAGRLGILTREKMDDPESTAYRQTLEFYENACRTAPSYVWSITRTNTRGDQLEAGRIWVRTQLMANAAGIAFHPLSQALQEFPEMRAHYEDVHRLLDAPAGSTVQMLARLGYAQTRPAPAPRHPLESRLLSLP